MQDVWHEFLKIVREEAGSRVVETWFKAISFKRWDALHKEVYLQAPNLFVQNWIQQHYITLFQVHLGRLLNVESPKVVFIDTSNKEKTSLVAANNRLIHATNDNKKRFKGAHLVPIDASRNRNMLKKSMLQKQNSYINTSYLFDTFVVGPSNSLAYAAAYAVTEKPGYLYNPMFLYGGSGLGKTHLLHAIGNGIKEKHAGASVLYQTADQFVNEFITAIRFNKIDVFQKKYRTADVLLIDDIQFFSKKEQTQEAFFHIFNTLYDEHKQIVFSSDTFPQAIEGIAERLRSRLACGLIADIYIPSLETKIAILRKKADSHSESVSDEVIQFIASNNISNVRELEGALIRVIAFAHLTKQTVSIELAKKVLIDPEQRETRLVDFGEIIHVLSKKYRYSISQLRSKDRNKDLVSVRQKAMFFMQKLTKKSLREIGVFLGGRNHTTVKHAIDKIEQKIKNNQDFEQEMQIIERAILR